MASFSLSSLSKSLSSFLPSQSNPNSRSSLSPPTVLHLPQNASGFTGLASNRDQKSSSSSSSSTPTYLPSYFSNVDDFTAITCPSLAYANTLFFKSGHYNVQVVVAENEPEEKLLGRFRRAVFKAGVIQECKRRRFFESSQDKRKRKSREASRRIRKRRPQPKVPTQTKEELYKKKEDDEDDNWDLPEGDLPY